MAKKRRTSRKPTSPKRAARKSTRRKPKHRLAQSRLRELEKLLAAAKADASTEFDFDHDVCQSVYPEENTIGFESLSLARRRYLGCWYLEAEVNNGGFMQFFDNRGRAVARDALAFLEERGPKPVANLLRRGMRAFPGGDLPARIEKILDITIADTGENDEPGPIGRRLRAIDDKFFKGTWWTPVLIRKRLEYVRDHAAGWHQWLRATNRGSARLVRSASIVQSHD